MSRFDSFEHRRSGILDSDHRAMSPRGDTSYGGRARCSFRAMTGRGSAGRVHWLYLNLNVKN